ncbi:nitroreductase family protein [Sabulicella rubraurantiaca]|uniref:nitroreductase family protein n=1 Tax=Sabulicella rubraurantiaca TaxID=2811429 RepID=UPI001A959CDD|nr:nitroreductase family protein [Sabulicella rubraurantiaca]
MKHLLAARYGQLPFAPPEGDAPEGLRLILDRRVTRRFSASEVEDGVLNLVLAGAQSAPSKSDLQQYSILVLRDATKRRRIAEAIGSMPWIVDAPVFLLFCADLRRNRAIGERVGRPNRNDNLDSFLNGTVDTALALGFAVMAAEALGLGSCPVSYVRNHLDLMRELAALPDGVFPVAGLALGWPETRNEVSARLPPEVVVHREAYSDASPEPIAVYDAARPRAKPRYPNVHGPAPEGCTWSENVARQLSVPERAEFRAWLEAHGFTLR